MASNRRGLKILGIVLLVLLLAAGGLTIYVLRNMPHHSAATDADLDAARKTVSASAAATAHPEVLDAIRKGLAYLRAHQEATGHFVLGELSPKPAYTALVLECFVASPDGYRIDDHDFLQKAVEAIVQSQHKSGGIYHSVPGFTFSNYSTALALTALKNTGDPRFDEVIARAQAFLKRTQHSSGDANDGGFGYGEGKRPDLNNTMTVLEALEASGLSKDDPAYQRVVQFVENTQNRSESNKQPWAGDGGGFVYRPGESPAGTYSDADGNVRFASYGTMTYAGLVSFLYAGVDKADPRVQSAYDWIRKNYDLHANVNMKDVGLYYYYRIMAKALLKYGDPVIATPDGEKHRWAEDLSQTLIKRQDANGSWINDNPQYLEDDRVLVTAYAVRTLIDCYKQLEQPPAPPGAKE